MTRTLQDLIEAVRREAERAEFPVDRAVYERAGRDWRQPILCAGALEAPVCCLGRDLGKDEVALGEPLVGAGGRLVRVGVYEARLGQPAPSAKQDRRLEPALAHVLLTNTVPYKPPGNRAYSDAIKERFRPFLAELLAAHWTGHRVITLGTEAFQWFTRYAEPGAAEAFWKRDDRYEAELAVVLEADDGTGKTVRKPITLAPLPHPSPLNQRWYRQFPDLLKRRLEETDEHR